jgi:hypothetical protein
MRNFYLAAVPKRARQESPASLRRLDGRSFWLACSMTNSTTALYPWLGLFHRYRLVTDLDVTVQSAPKDGNDVA